MRYREKSPHVDAFQLTRARLASFDDWPGWMLTVWNRGPKEPNSLTYQRSEFRLHAPPGIWTIVYPNDWICRREDDTVFALDPEEFERRFEPVPTA